MKKIVFLVLVAAVLWGCDTQPVFETLGGIPVQGTEVPAQQILVELPGDMLAPVMKSEDSGSLYICDDFSMTLQTLPGGDLDRTVRSCTGFEADALTVMCLNTEPVKRYQIAWSAAGETQTQTCRTMILDDGSYHYVLTVMADSPKAGSLGMKWQRIFDTFRLASEPTPAHIGS